jgi:hypothetical protein
MTMLFASVLLSAISFAAPTVSSGGFQLLATYRGQGGQFASTVAPGPTPGSERLYASYLYMNDTLEVVSVDPVTGDVQVFANPAKGEYGARCMTTGPDGNVYLGTLPGAHFLKLDTKAGRLVDLGRPSATEQFIWDVTFGPDGKLYGVTQPNARLIRYDPATGALADLGRMDPTELFAHYVAASTDGFVYAGIGPGKMNVAAYQIATGEHREILPAAFQVAGTANVYRGTDGNVYAIAGKQYFRLQDWTATPIDQRAAVGKLWPNRTHDGHFLSVQPGALVIKDARTGATTQRPYAYQGRELAVFRIGFGPDAALYGSTILPARLVKLDAARGRFDELGDLGGGEVYIFLPHGHKLLMAGYSTGAPLMTFDVTQPFQKAPAPNPALVDYAGGDESWRALAAVAGPDGKAYLGGLAGYGKLGGPLIAWDVEHQTIDAYPGLIHDQSISALDVWKGRIIAGTSIYGGMGAKPTQKDARMLLWDPVTRKIVFQVAPLPGAVSIENLAVAPNGLVYAIASRKMFVFDVERRAVTAIRDLPFPGGTVYGSLGIGPNGRIWGLAPDAKAGIFAINPSTNDIELVATPPKPATGGFAIRGDYLYFAAGADVYRYALPTRHADSH